MIELLYLLQRVMVTLTWSMLFNDVHRLWIPLESIDKRLIEELAFEESKKINLSLDED